MECTKCWNMLKPCHFYDNISQKYMPIKHSYRVILFMSIIYIRLNYELGNNVFIML